MTCYHLHYCVTRDDECAAVSWHETAEEAIAEMERLRGHNDGHGRSIS